MGRINNETLHESKKLTAFRISSVTIHEHPILGNIHLGLCQDLGTQEDVYTSVIIGANGIGKSYLLRVIAEVFCCLESLRENSKCTIPHYYFDIVYTIQGEEMEFANFIEKGFVEHERKFTQFVFKKAGHDVSKNDILLPNKVIALATTIADKYIAKSTKMYCYKGLRNENSPSSTGTRTMVRKTVSGLLGSLDMKVGFRKELKELLMHLGLQPRLELSYNIRYKDVFVKENMSAQDLQQIFEEQGTFFKRATKLWGTHNYEKIKEDSRKLNVAADFLKRLAQNGFDDKRRLLKYDLLEEDKIIEDREALSVLSTLDLLTYPSLKVYKNADGYEFDYSSSGESILFCQMVSIMSDIEPNSLVLIDEPENSSHPNWQMNYMGWIKGIFKQYFDCHFVISTHSHFILTNLEPSTSDIIALEKKDGIIRNVSEGVKTFNWSVDDILYRVFGVCNTRNHAFETDIMTLYKLISERSDNINEITQMLRRLRKVTLPKDDPLLEILDQAKKYVEAKKTI